MPSQRRMCEKVYVLYIKAKQEVYYRKLIGEHEDFRDASKEYEKLKAKHPYADVQVRLEDKLPRLNKENK